MLSVDEPLPAPAGDEAWALAVVKCRHCGESARVRREFVGEVEAWFAGDHRCVKSGE